MSYAFAILTVYFLLHLLTPVKLARLMALTTFLIGLYLFLRAWVFMAHDAFHGRFTTGQLCIGLPILGLGLAHVLCPVLFWRNPPIGRAFLVILGWFSLSLAGILAAGCVLLGAPQGHFGGILEVMWGIFVSITYDPPSLAWVVGVWAVFIGNSGLTAATMRRSDVAEWCQSHVKVTAGSKGPRGFPVITEEGEDKGGESPG